MTPQERSMRARLGAHTSWARTTDPSSRTAKARAAATSRFVQEARKLHPNASEEAIERSAEHLRKAHFARLGMASGRARRAKSTQNRSAA